MKRKKQKCDASNSRRGQKSPPTKYQGPDEYRQYGPFRASRWGTLTLLENLCTPEQQRELINHWAECYPEICDEIDECVQGIVSLVNNVDPVHLLYRAYWHFCSVHLERGPEESSIEHKHLVAQRMLDYIQSVIIGVGKDSDEKLTERQFYELRSHVDKLYKLLGTGYFLARSSSLDRQGEIDANKEEFVVLAQMHYLTVRGDRYQLHEVPHLRGLLSAQSDVISKVFGVDSDAIIVGFERLLDSLTKGLPRAINDLHSFRDDTLVGQRHFPT